ncbi:hypothetical protein EDB84DRAFT_1494898 [Lactarius hengduanensis]|nr:hypothetical protein EDB84DRAFT_1494898 [Lactarius hengduanensis]
MHQRYTRTSMEVNGERHIVSYWPREPKSGMFGGNSNWRIPISSGKLPTHREPSEIPSIQRR